MSVMRSVELFAGNYSFLSSFLSSFFRMVTGNLGIGQNDNLYGYPFGQPTWLSFWPTYMVILLADPHQCCNYEMCNLTSS